MCCGNSDEMFGIICMHPSAGSPFRKLHTHKWRIIFHKQIRPSKNINFSCPIFFPIHSLNVISRVVPTKNKYSHLASIRVRHKAAKPDGMVVASGTKPSLFIGKFRTPWPRSSMGLKARTFLSLCPRKLHCVGLLEPKGGGGCPHRL